MKKIFVLFVTCCILSGCSLLPKITFSKPGVVPSSINKSYDYEYYKNKEEGIIYKKKTINFDQKERKMTIKEKILSFLQNLVGWSFWIVLALIFFAPSLFSFIFGRFVENIFGVSTKALESTVRAIKNGKRNGGKYLEELKLEHSKSPKIKKYINNLRAKTEYD